MQNEDYGKMDGNGWFGESSRWGREGPAMRQALELWRPAEGDDASGGLPPPAETRLPPPPMGFAKRFVSLETTPRAIAEGVQEDDGPMALEGRFYKRRNTKDALPWAYFGALAKNHGTVLKRLLKAADGRGGANILLYGEPGTGKTAGKSSRKKACKGAGGK